MRRRYVWLLSIIAGGAFAAGVLAVARPSVAAPTTGVLTVSPTRINFGRVAVGDTKSAPVTITNNSTDTTYYCRSGVLSGASDAPFYVGNDGWGGTGGCYMDGIAPGQTATIYFEFRPEATGKYTSTDGWITIGDAPTGGGSVVATFTFSLSGTAVADAVASTDVTAKPSKISFGGVKLGETKTVTVTLTNNTSGDLLYTGGETPAYVSFDNWLPVKSTIEAGGTATVDFHWTPLESGNLSGTVTMNFYIAPDYSTLYTVDIPVSGKAH